MKHLHINNKVKTAAKSLLIAGVLGTTFTSCNKFLSIEPLNDIVLENYWTEEADVTSVLSSCYSQLESADCIRRMIIWGEGRSDNMTSGSGTSNEMNQIFKENILETNSFTNWAAFYTCINRCNTVLHYAPEVYKLDPNFTESEMKAVMAEATALRTLCYFYLMRTFRDVPYETEPSIDDTQSFITAPMKFNELLDRLIADMEAVADDAVKSYGEETIENTCRITRWACYSILADLYLWKGEWQKCIDNCDKVIDRKISEYEKELEENPSTIDIELYGRYPLIMSMLHGSKYAGNSYTSIFGTGNSFESIFELSYETSKSTTNSAISSFYGSNAVTAGQIALPLPLSVDPFASTESKYFTKTDGRFIENISIGSDGKGYVGKYVKMSSSYQTSTSTGSKPEDRGTRRSTQYANWIIYRLTDVMLMRAEAEIMLAQDGDIESKHMIDAFACISAVSQRANSMRIQQSDTLRYSDYATSKLAMENLLFEERQRELMFEGKRWYDLVRLSLREKDNTRMINLVLPKFQDNTSVIKIKLSAQDALFWPYNRNELKLNPNIVQNPAFNTGDNFERN